VSSLSGIYNTLLRQSVVLATSITSANVSAAGTLILLIKMPAINTFYRGHRPVLCCLPGIISLIIMCIAIIFRYYFYVGGCALPGRGSDLNSEPAAHCASARVMLYCTWRPSDMTTGL